MPTIALGRYRHYKGKEYIVCYVARHEETLEHLVIYQSIENLNLVWARPLDVFQDCVESEGRIIPRFQYIGSN
jgi:cyclomaltodextrinase